MMTSYFNLLKYAATGITSPDMTYYDKMRASTLMGGAVKTLTGQPPLSFKADGKPITVWSMKGNGSQTNTPTPDNPVMPTFCGVRTGNLFDYAEYVGTYMENAGLWEYTGRTGTVFRIPCTENTVYTLSLNKTFSLSVYRIATVNTDSVPTLNNPITVTDIVRRTSVPDSYSFTTPAGSKYILFQVNASVASEVAAATMLNTGDTALPYEPYGWAEKITCAGQTTPVYLGQVSTVRRIKKLVLNGTENFNIDTYLRLSIFIGDIKTFASRTGRSYCSHYECLYHAEPYDNDWNNVYYQSGSTLFFHDKRFSTVADFKAYLADQYANGTPVTIWYILATPTAVIVSEPLCKIGDYADELHSNDAGVSIPTVKGSNTLTVETPIQPSKMSITYRG